MRWFVGVFAIAQTILVFSGCGTSAQNTQVQSDPDYVYAPHLDPRGRDLLPYNGTTKNVLLYNATILTAAGDRIENGYLWLKDGKIARISAQAIDATGAEVVDLQGKFVTPGLIDTHSHLGVYAHPGVSAHSDGNEATSPSTPFVDSLYSVWPQDPGFDRAVAGGVTLMQILPGSANLVGGDAVTIQMHPGVSARAMVVEVAPRGIKMACGENPKRVYGNRGQLPSTRMGNRAMFRRTFQKAIELRQAIARHEREMKRWLSDPEKNADTEPPTPPARDHGLEALLRVLAGETLVHVHCYRADEMVQILELADEFGFSIRSFHHAVEAYKIRDLLSSWEVGVSTWADWWGFKIEAHDAVLENAALLSSAGVRSIIHSDSAIGIQRLNQEAAKAYYAGLGAGISLTEDDALRWITANPAWALGVDEHTGTIEEGKRADVVVWSHHPFSTYARADLVFVEGVMEYDRSQRDREPWSDFELGNLPPAGPVAPVEVIELPDAEVDQ